MAVTRTIEVHFYPRDEWWLFERGKINESLTYSRDYKSNFACHSIKGGKIIYLSDIWVQDRDLEFAKARDEFKEVCNFEIYNKSMIHSFKGTFIEALEYVKKHFEVQE